MIQNPTSVLRNSISRVLPMTVFAACIALSNSQSNGNDVIQLADQVQISGKILSESDKGSRPHLIVEVDPELRIAIPKSRVKRTIRESDMAEYLSVAAKVPEVADAHFEFGKACKQKLWKAQAEYHYRRAVLIDPNHNSARKALGYTRDGNSWVLAADLKRQNGLIQVGASWVLPAAYARDKATDEAQQASKRWIKEFSNRQKRMRRDPQKNADAITSIDDPLASAAFADALASTRGSTQISRATRMMYVKKLGTFRTGVAVQALVEAGLVEPDAEVRGYALEQIREYGAPSAIGHYWKLLQAPKKSPTQVGVALRALNQLPVNWEMWPQYVDALVTTHTKDQQAGPGMQVGSSSQGGSGLTTGGGKPKVQHYFIPNAGALQLLRQIAPEVDYRYDQDAWRRYFASKLLQTPGSLRRDP